MNIINISFLILFIILFILEIILFDKNIFIKYGIIIYKKKYILDNKCFSENIGKIIKKDDIIINIINENLGTFEANRKLIVPKLDPIIYGYLEINKNNIITIYKKPFSYSIIILIMIINILNEIINREVLATLIVIIIFGSLYIIINILKIISMKYDLEYFINYGK